MSTILGQVGWGNTWSVVRDRLAFLLGISHDGRRDLYMQFGYPKLLLYENLWALYARNPIASRVVRVFPQSTWRKMPVIRDEAGDSPEKDNRGGGTYSPFVEAVDQLFEKHNVIRLLERADRVASLGQYGVLFLGFRDGKDPAEPLEEGKAPLLFLQPYAQINVTIEGFEQDPTSPRFGRPKYYQLKTGNPLSGEQVAQRKQIRAHWSRVIHISEMLEEDDVFGTPRLTPVYNALMDLEKVLGSGAETFWLNARPGLSLEADPEFAFTPEQLADYRRQAEEYEHQLRRIMALQGVKANSLSATVADPEPNITTILDVISGATGIPKRILIGSERGELGGDNDESNWSEVIAGRRDNFASPTIIKPFVATLIMTKNLPKPQGQYWVEWPGAALSPKAQGEVAVAFSTALSNYVRSPGAEVLVPPSEFRQKALGLPAQPPEDSEEDIARLIERGLGRPAGGAPGEEEPEGGEVDEGDPAVQDQFARQRAIQANKGRVDSLYVYRPIVNAGDIIEWAKAQGFDTTLSPEDLHVTIAYSTAHVDWIKVGEPWATEPDGSIRIKAGGPRAVDDLGKEGATVLMFASSELSWRHSHIRHCGASWPHGDDYCPHITITYNRGDLDLVEIEPYTGEIILGPEMFEPVKQSWADTIVENRKRERRT